jgi:hypothetical protein
MMQRFYTGLVYRTNVEADLSPWRSLGKHYWLYGLGIARHTWDADLSPDKPLQKKDESDEAYAAHIDEWRAESHKVMPIKIEAVNPYCVIPDPSSSGREYLFEVHSNYVFNIKKFFPNWKNPLNRKITDTAEYVMYWDADWRSDMIDGEAILASEVLRHKYGSMPYTFINSGLGNITSKGEMAKRYVGLLD